VGDLGGSRGGRGAACDPVRRIIREGDLGEIARLSDEFWYHLPDRYGPELLDRVARTPAAELERRPRVLYASRLAAEFSDDSRDPTLRRVIDFHRAVGARYASRFEAFTDPGDVLIAGTTASIGARLAGDLDEAERIAARVQARLDELDVAEAASWHATIAGGRPGWLANQRSLTKMLAGDYDGAIRHATAAFVQAGPAPHHNWSASGGAAHLALLAAIRGHRALAEGWLDRLFEKGPVHPRVEHLTTLGAKLARAHLAMDRLDAGAAARELEAAGAATEPVELWPFVAHAEARYGQLFGDPHIALVRLDAARFAHGLDDRQWAQGGYVLARARADLLAELGDASGVAAAVEQHPEAVTLLVAVARSHLLAGRWSAAAEAAERGLRGASVRDAVELRVMSAAALLHLHDPDAARRQFGIALATRSGDDHRAPFTSIDAADAAALFQLAGLAEPFPDGAPARSLRRFAGGQADTTGPSSDSELVPRPRLLRLLDDAPRIVLVRAGAGAGKTAVASEWVAERRRRGHQTVWLQVDSVTASRVEFWRRAVAVLEEHGRVRADGDLGRFLEGGIPVEAVPGLVVELLYQHERPVRVVVDDLHLLAPDAVRDIVWVLERAPHLILVATSRGGTLVDDAEMLARLGGRVIGAAELALTSYELGELAAREGLALDSRDLAVLARLTRGNPLTARLAMAAIVRGGVGPIDAERLAETLAESVAREVLAEFPDARERRAAVRLAVVPSADPRLAAELVDLPDAEVESLLGSFRRRGLGELDDEGRHPGFRFHVLVRHVLRREAQRQLDVSERARLLRIAAVHAERRNDPTAAIALLIDAQAYDAVWPVVVRNFSELATHRVDEMITLLSRIPASDLAEHGTLGIAFAIMLSERESTPSGRVRRLVATGLRSLHRLPPPHDDAERHLRLLAEFGGLRAARQYERAVAAGEAVVAQQAAMVGSDERAREVFAVGMMQVVVTDVLAGAFATAVSHAAELAHDDHLGRSSHRRAVLAEAHALEGDMVAAARLVRSLDGEATEEWAASRYARGWHLARALLAAEHGDPRGSLAALEPLERAEFSEHRAYALWANGFAHLLAGDPQQGLDSFALSFGGRRVRGMSRYAADLLTAVQADLALAAGDLERADSVLAGRAGSAPLALARARLALARDSPRHALRSLDEVDWAETTRRHLGESLLITAVVHLRDDNRSSADFALARATGILRRSGLASPFAMVPRRDLQLLGAELPAALSPLADPFAALGGRATLSPRERAVLAQLVSSGSVVQIAEALFVSPNTVKTQLKSIYRKFGVSSREDAVQEARRQGLLTDQ